MWQRDLKAMPKKKKRTNEERNTKKTSKCLAKSVPQKTVCGGGDQEASGQAQLSLVPK